MTNRRPMLAPANLFPGLNDISDTLEQFPMETSRYVTLLHEIEAKCVHSVPLLNGLIDKFISTEDEEHSLKEKQLTEINTVFDELMPSLEEKMHVSSLMVDSLEQLTNRLELAYEVVLRNEEIPKKLRLGGDNHPAMHLHYELMEKVDTKGNAKSSQALKSESRREAMAANKKGNDGNPITSNRQIDDNEGQNQRKRTNGANGSTAGSTNGPEQKKRRRRANNLTTIAFEGPTPAGVKSNRVNQENVTTTTTTPNNGLKTNEYGEPLYCYCNQVAYGEMVGCDGADCELEWFHLQCIGLETIPKGKWYCDDCKRKLKEH
ncbi:hypothetical protein NCAS_0G02670 [Naumovozyma castellii]|uniref:Chromatin modification-related protein n=1 Tax=Naumovozyma castellii TaxID=27288 RepID=G0VIB9_NAUCA|nr:hypothetical protein NCAS_0G02670 [Naumovozyma castellii CBS 4309]CCC71154.1 hypothetical protein NCAS_0G02670 [Naumovozyma castellii CBS 4309]